MVDVFKSVNELGVVPLKPPNNGLLRKKKTSQTSDGQNPGINPSYLAPSEARDAANGVDAEPKPLAEFDEIFDRVFVKYVAEESFSSDFSFDPI